MEVKETVNKETVKSPERIFGDLICQLFQIKDLAKIEVQQILV